MQQFLKLPIRFSHFFEKRRFPTCTIQNSISYNIHLLTTTILGENKQNLKYGSSFWDDEFDVKMTQDRRADIIVRDLERAIALFEKRLVNVRVRASARQIETYFNARKQLTRRVEMEINGTIARTNDPYSFATGFFIGPFLLS
ncbi:MAG: GPW/gp25 family protein [Chitinophagaceae bacterium]